VRRQVNSSPGLSYRRRAVQDGRVGGADAVDEWLLEGDPAVRWRVLRRLGHPPRTVAREQARVATEGWGARLLAEQNDDGGWGAGVYSPKWTSTTYTLLRLVQLGLPAGHPAALRGCDRMWEWQARWRTPETCISALLVRLTAALGHGAPGLDALVNDVLDQQQDDGGWNCATRTDRGKHSSFNTTVLVLEALDAYTGSVQVSAAARRGREFFLQHRLYQSHRTGAEAIRGSTRLRAFGEWHFDVLRGLEMFAATGKPDERLADAVTVVRRARRKDGRWPVHAPHPGKRFFEPEPPGPSRWTTARALDVLHWWGDTGSGAAR
jgi:hypothetical protein